MTLNPSRRSDYDAGLVMRGGDTPGLERPLHVEVALESSKASPIRRLLTVIAAVMVIGMVMQVTVMFMSYQRAKAVMGEDPTSPAAEKVYLQDFYQTYGIRAASRAEADLLLADMRRKEQAERATAAETATAGRRGAQATPFQEESRRLGDRFQPTCAVPSRTPSAPGPKSFAARKSMNAPRKRPNGRAGSRKLIASAVALSRMGSKGG
jgi:hypothetical protein